MVHDGTGGVVALARAGHGHAGGRNVAAILSWIELPAKPAIHGQVKDGLVSTRGVLTSTHRAHRDLYHNVSHTGYM